MRQPATQADVAKAVELLFPAVRKLAEGFIRSRNSINEAKVMLGELEDELRRLVLVGDLPDVEWPSITCTIDVVKQRVDFGWQR